MYLYIKNFIKKYVVWFVLMFFLIAIIIVTECIKISDQKKCSKAKDYSLIISCAGIEDNYSDNEKNLKYLQSKKNIIESNKISPPYYLLNYYYSLIKEDKEADYVFLLNQSNRCRRIDPDCTSLYISLLEKNSKKPKIEDKIKIYEDYLDNIIINKNENCIINENYIFYKKLIITINYSDKYLNKFQKCIELKRLEF